MFSWTNHSDKVLDYNIYSFQPPPLKIELELDVESNEAHLAGIYLQQTGLINEKPFWLQQNGGHAIWSSNVSYGSVWLIGDVTQLGEFQGKIFVNADENNIYPNASLPVTFQNIGMYCNWPHIW